MPSPHNVLRMFDVYKPSDVDEYYRWKEHSIRFLQLYHPTDLERFVKYSEDFERHHFVPNYISNMIGVLEACEEFPSEKMYHQKEVQGREEEVAKVESLEQNYESYRKFGRVKINTPEASNAFREWHAAASVLFDRWFYPTDDDWIKFQNIKASGNGFSLNDEYKSIYSSYKKLMARLKDGRNLRSSSMVNQVVRATENNVEIGKVNIFISYSHSDEKWLERLKTHLKVLAKFSENVEFWEDTKLRGGDKWREEITAAIGRANVAVLLVSTDFLASDFIANDELPPILRKAEEEGTRVLPLIVSPCVFELSEISEFQAINSPDRTLADLGDDEAAINRVYLELIKNIQGLL